MGIHLKIPIIILGWRVNMEDSHIAKFNIVPDVHIFGVFDGHGGKRPFLFEDSVLFSFNS